MRAAGAWLSTGSLRVLPRRAPVAFSCKRRGFCPSCGARRMAESAALLVDEVLPEQPMRQWVLSFPFQLRFLFASRPEIMGWVLGIVYRVIATHLVKKAGHTHQVAKTGAVTLIQRFGSALNLNVHFHMLFLDGVYVEQSHGSARFRWVKAPTSPERHCCKVSDEAAFCLIQRPYISKTLLTRRISPRGSP